VDPSAGFPLTLFATWPLGYETFPMLRRGLVLVAVPLLFARPAFAQFSSPEDATWEAGYNPGKQKRRSDFTAGVGFGVGVGSASGYPNELAKIGDPKYEASTGALGSSATSLWIGVALRDWMVFGVGIHPYSIQSRSCPVFASTSNAPPDCTAAIGGAYVLHIEAYPLFYQGPAFENLGIFTEIGAGARNIIRGNQTIAEGGAVAFTSLGIVYEPIRLGDHFSMGPYVQFSHEFSDTLTADQGVLGFRAVYYGGP